MGWSLKKAFKSFGKKVSSGVKSAVSTVSSGVKSAVTVGTTALKNMYNPQTISSAMQGYAEGGIAGAVAGASVSALGSTMAELDKSGEYNENYAYKKYGFPSAEEYEKAKSYGYDNYDDWKTVKDLLGSNVGITQTVVPASDVAKTEVDATGNIVVTSGASVEKKDVGAGIGGVALGALALKMIGVI